MLSNNSVRKRSVDRNILGTILQILPLLKINVATKRNTAVSIVFTEMKIRIVSAITVVSVAIILSISALVVAKISVHSTGFDGWAVLLEMNDFPEGWTDLSVGFINSERMQTALLSLGWESDHIYCVEDNLTLPVVEEAVEWLVNNTNSDDIALLYISTHGMWMRNVLGWNDWFPVEWENVDASTKVLMVDTCFAEEFIYPIRDDPSRHISLACCSEDEVSWAGVEDEGLPIIGSVWNYYFTNALCNSSADLGSDGTVSIEEAFNFSTPLVQRYMNETVFAVPEFLESYHDIGIYPENYDAYPHPVMDDTHAGQLVIPEFPSFLLLPPFMITTLLVLIVYRRKYSRTQKMKLKRCMHAIANSPYRRKIPALNL